MGEIIQLFSRRWRTYCQDCDPACARPLDMQARRDPRTGDYVTPCPDCGRAALADVPRARSRGLAGR